ncbi:MAG: extracellular solute-binding protein [Clostridia bacterium]|nr:extracellular solute-binding protein [Clostridia bacterium]
MKKALFAKLLALLLVVLMSVSIFVACGKDDEKKDPDTIGIDITNGEENPHIAAKDYEGYEFTFLCQPYMNGNAYSVDYMVSESETGDTILDAVYRRNEMLKEKYNITFAQTQVKDLITTVRTQVMGGATEFDIVIGDCEDLATLARENLLLNLNSIDRFDMTKSYWDGNAAEQLLVGDKLYFTNCDLNIQEVAFVVYFNKQMIKDYELTSPYEYMENDEWTIDNWAKLVKNVSKDVDGGGEWTETDIYGTLYEHHNTRMFLFGAGVRATTNNDQGVPEVTLFNTDKTVNVYEKCKDVFKSFSAWSIDDMNNDDTHGYDDKWDYARSLFCQDLYLFHYEGTIIIHQFADMESEFGIVPFPKYDKNQKEYYSMYPYNCVLMAIPNSVEDIERTANIVEDLNYYSSVILKPAWYDTLLSRRYARDDDSEASLDIILEGRVYDVGMYYNFGGICKEVLDQDARKSNVTQLFARKQKAINADIAATYRDFGLVD